MMTALVALWTLAKAAYAAVTLFCVFGWVCGMLRAGRWHERLWFLRLSLAVTAVTALLDIWAEDWIRVAIDVVLFVFWVGQIAEHETKGRARHQQRNREVPA